MLAGLTPWVEETAATRSRLRCSSSFSVSVTMASAFFCTYLQSAYRDRDSAIGGTKEKYEIDRSRGFMRSATSAIKNHTAALRERRNAEKAILSSRFFSFALGCFAVPWFMPENTISASKCGDSQIVVGIVLRQGFGATVGEKSPLHSLTQSSGGV